ncbi:molybdopterin-binding protein [Mesorhizobium soli]|uniref:Molybdopterin molybdenumtransferase n=2 Tax=Pseudaminobacter soli (ex Li et al. 2025) TaxID=1295366 RepID=A0A2P7S4L9_9HYPH|nr:molybdopterin-binding protein [Mesorhizobium soli]
MSVSSQRPALTGVEAARALLLDGLEAVAPIDVPLAEALGCVAAEMPPLAEPVPSTDEAVMDGWAFASADLVGASSYSPAVPPGEARWVEAGQPMPRGCDCVVEPGQVEAAEEQVLVLADAVPGQGVRRAGQDILAGQALIAAGSLISPFDLLLARRAGIEHLSVRRSSLRLIDVAASDGGTVTVELIAELARAAGAWLVGIEAVARDAVSIAAALDAEPADIVLLVGGTGLGHYDETAMALAERGVLSAHGIALEPGRSAAVGRLGRVPVIALPGAPDQAFAVWLTLALPALDRLAGRLPRRELKLPLARKIASIVGITEPVLLKRENETWVPLATGVLPLHLIAEADAWLAVPADSEGFAAGTEVAAFRLREGGTE